MKNRGFVILGMIATAFLFYEMILHAMLTFNIAFALPLSIALFMVPVVLLRKKLFVYFGKVYNYYGSFLLLFLVVSYSQMNRLNSFKGMVTSGAEVDAYSYSAAFFGRNFSDALGLIFLSIYVIMRGKDYSRRRKLKKTQNVTGPVE